MIDIDKRLTAHAAESYLAAIANALEADGFTLPDARPYVFDGNTPVSGVITLLDALSDGDTLALTWRETHGWHAGYPTDDGGIDCLTSLELDIAPPPWIVVHSIRQISRNHHRDGLEAGQPERSKVYGPLELLTYAPECAELLKVATAAEQDRVCRISGQEPREPATWIVDNARTTVAAVWAQMHARNATAPTPPSSSSAPRTPRCATSSGPAAPKP
jgi:hypothetical protein